jgi:pimeloyl-ACP methyl ester carboxylesterase
MPHVKLDNLTLYYEDHGRGTPLVMIRGVSTNADHWYAQVPNLVAKYRVITFDNRGVARSTDPGGDYTIADMAADTLGLMDALGLDKAHVYGLSMGGMIAQELAINHPDRIFGLILAATHCGGDRQVAPTPEVEAVFKEMVFVGSEEAKRNAATCLFAPQTLAGRMDLVQEYVGISLKHPVPAEILIKQWQAVVGHDTFDRLGLITAPTLVLTGDVDVLIPPGNSEVLAQHIPGAELKVVPGGGHQILVEQAEACNRAVLEFLERIAV